MQKSEYILYSPNLLETFPTLQLANEKVGNVFHGMDAIAQTARIGVEDVLIVFWVVGEWILEDVEMDEEEKDRKSVV